MNLLLSYVGSPRFRKAMRSKPGQRGFSLIELIIAVAVIAILSAAVLPQFANQSIKAANATAKDIVANAVKECGAKMANNNSSAASEQTKVITYAGGADGMVKGYTISGTSTATSAYKCDSNFKAIATTATSAGLHSYCYTHNSDDSYTFGESTTSTDPCPAAT